MAIPNVGTPEWQKRLDGIGTSMMKAIRLHCLDCSGGIYAEVRNCNCRTCALWVLKDNKRKAAKNREKLKGSSRGV